MMDIIKDLSGSLSRVLGSASKIVLLMFAGATCAALFTGHIDANVFSAAMMLVLGFYFGKNVTSGGGDSK